MYFNNRLDAESVDGKQHAEVIVLLSDNMGASLTVLFSGQRNGTRAGRRCSRHNDNHYDVAVTSVQSPRRSNSCRSYRSKRISRTLQPWQAWLAATSAEVIEVDTRAAKSATSCCIKCSCGASRINVGMLVDE